MRIPRTKEGSSLCVGRAGSVRPGSARRASVCAPAAIDPRPRGGGLPRLQPAPCRACPALTTATPLLLSGGHRSGVTSAGRCSRCPGNCRQGNQATPPRRVTTRLRRPRGRREFRKGPRPGRPRGRAAVRGGPEGGAGAGGGCPVPSAPEVLTVLRAERSAQRGTFRSPAGELSRGTVPHLECLWKM